MTTDIRALNLSYIRDELLMNKEIDANSVYTAYNQALFDDLLYAQLNHWMKASNEEVRRALWNSIRYYLKETRKPNNL
jgi:hypothetical protein